MESNVKKQDVINIIENLRNDMNDSKAQEILQKLESMSDEELGFFLSEQKIYTEEDVRLKLHSMLYDTKFKPLNDIISYGRSGNTIHIHVVPKDARFLLSREGFKSAELSLIDALEKIQAMLKDDEKYSDIQNVYAVSGLIKRPISRWFEKLGFDVKTMSIEEARDDKELSNFYDRFKEQKTLGRAVLPREKLFSEKWQEAKESRKSELLKEVKPKDKVLSSAIEATEEVIGKNKVKDKDKELENMSKERQIQQTKDIGG